MCKGGAGLRRSASEGLSATAVVAKVGMDVLGLVGEEMAKVAARGRGGRAGREEDSSSESEEGRVDEEELERVWRCLRLLADG